MDIKQLTTVIRALRRNHGLDILDLLILDYINDMSKEQGSLLTMQLLNGFDESSAVTTHVHMKKLIKLKLLERTHDATNLRVKQIKLTDEAHKLIASIKDF